MNGFETREIHKKGLELIEKGDSLFITGKAGTGKTMFLKYIIEQLGDKRRIVTLSPTGVAARKACGFTIHSFLKLPLGPYIPKMKKYGLYKLNEFTDAQLIRALDIIVIDEISMVRCDLLDEVDDVLRHYRNSTKPFGGVQLVLFGDLYQLMPVAKDEEAEQLSEYYETLNFYSSKAFQKLDCKLLELRKVYRQKNTEFVNILNDLRVGRNKSKVLSRISCRYRMNFTPNDSEGYIRLTTHNWRAKKYNNEKLDSLFGTEYEFKAYIEDYFPKQEFPTDYVIRLKRGSRVMFVRNDNTTMNYVNGTLGTVTHVDDDSICVRVDDTGKSVWVEKQKWDFYRYRINKQTKEIYQELIGSFIQYPLKLAWAITIHKSQGLTFDKVIIDAGKAFADGQVYVAMSRCTDLQGVVLVSQITYDNIKVSKDVVNYLETAERIIVEDEEVDEEEHQLEEERNKVKSLPHGAIEKTLWLANDGLTLDEIVRHTGERIEIIYSHLSKLIERDFVDVHDYIDDNKYNAIRRTIKHYGVDTHPKILQNSCPLDVKIGEIIIVIASVKHGDPENYTHKVKEKKTKTFTKADFSSDIPTVTRGSVDRSTRPRNISLRKLSEKEQSLSTKRSTIFLSANDSKTKSIDQRIRDQRILKAANQVSGDSRPKFIVNYHAMSNRFGRSNNIVVSARDGYYIKSSKGRYYFLTQLKLAQAAGSLYVKASNGDQNKYTITHSDFNGKEEIVGELTLRNNIFTFTDINGDSKTRKMD